MRNSRALAVRLVFEDNPEVAAAAVHQLAGCG
jgi:hypothetical protein